MDVVEFIERTGRIGPWEIPEYVEAFEREYPSDDEILAYASGELARQTQEVATEKRRATWEAKRAAEEARWKRKWADRQALDALHEEALAEEMHRKRAKYEAGDFHQNWLRQNAQTQEEFELELINKWDRGQIGDTRSVRKRAEAQARHDFYRNETEEEAAHRRETGYDAFTSTYPTEIET